MDANAQTPLVEMKDISIAFGGVKAVDHAYIDLYPGEVVGLLGHNGAGKSCLIKILSGAYKRELGTDLHRWAGSQDRQSARRQALWRRDGLSGARARRQCRRGLEPLSRPRVAHPLGHARRRVHGSRGAQGDGRLNPNFRRFKEPVVALSGGQRQSVAIARAIHFDAKVLIMDEPTAALGPAETAQVGELVKQLKAQGLGIFLISHDIHDVFDLADRVTVMKNGQVVGSGRVQDMTKDEVLGMIIIGKCPAGAIPGPGAMALAS